LRKSERRRKLLVSSICSIVLATPEKIKAATTAKWLKDVPIESLDQAASRFEQYSSEESSEEDVSAQSTIEKARARGLSSKGAKKSDKPTEIVNLGIRIARDDGTFAVRDNDPDPPTQGQIKIAIFGDAAPANAALFLEFAARQDELSYARSLIDQIDMKHSIAIGGRVRGLEDRDLFGEKILIYGNREVLNTKTDRQLVSLAQNEGTQFSHNQPGLLTRKVISNDPRDLVAFAITLESNPSLDSDWTVIGKVLDDPAHIIPKLATLPTYQPEARTDSEIAATVFRTEYDTFRSVASAIGDSRVSNVFPGKILRRVEITRCSVSSSSSR